ARPLPRRAGRDRPQGRRRRDPRHRRRPRRLRRGHAPPTGRERADPRVLRVPAHGPLRSAAALAGGSAGPRLPTARGHERDAPLGPSPHRVRALWVGPASLLRAPAPGGRSLAAPGLRRSAVCGHGRGAGRWRAGTRAGGGAGVKARLTVLALAAITV